MRFPKIFAAAALLRRQSSSTGKLWRWLCFLLLLAVCLVYFRPHAAEPVFLSADSTTAEFIDSIGINVHLSFHDSPYANLPLITQELAALGVRHVRDGANLTPEGLDPLQAAAWLRLRSQGIRVNAMVDPRYAVKTVTARSLQALVSAGGGAVESVEGPNELDVSGMGDWPSVDRDYQRSIWEARSSLGLSQSDVSLVGPAMAFAANGEKLGDISAYADFGNLHPYPGGLAPSVIFPRPGRQQDFLSKSLAQASVMYGSLPIYVTESGWHNCFGDQKEIPATSLEAAARYIPRLFLENFNHGIRRTYLYELMAWRADPARTNHEYHWGLLEYDSTEKPAFRALKNLISLVSGPGVQVAAPTQTSAAAANFGYQLEASSSLSLVHHTALRAADGSLVLLLWQEVSSFSIPEQRDEDVPSRTVRVHLYRAAPRVRLFDIATGIQPIQQWSAVSTVEIQVPDHVVVVRVSPN
jgi:hypothetical protein